MKKYYHLLILVFLIGCKSDFEKIESLIKKMEFNESKFLIESGIKQNKSDSSSLANYYYLLGNMYFLKYENDSAIFYSTKSLTYGQNKNFPANSIKLLRNLGDLYVRKHKKDSALVIFQRLSQLSQNQGDFKNYGYSLARMAWIYARDSTVGQKYLDQAFHIADSLKNYQLFGLSHYALTAFRYPEQIDSIVFDFKKAIDYFEKANTIDWLLISYNNLGTYYILIQDFKNAIIYLEKAFELAEQNHIYSTLVAISSNIGDVMFAMQQYEGAQKYYLKTKTYAFIYNNIPGKISSAYHLGKIEKEAGKLDLAINYLDEAIRISDQFDPENVNRIYSLEQIAEINLQLRRPQKVKEYCLQIMDELKNKNFQFNKLDILAKVGSLLAKIGEHEMANSLSMDVLDKSKMANDYRTVIICAQVLYNYYDSMHLYPTSLKYLKILNSANDSIYIDNQMFETGKLQVNIENKEINLNLKSKVNKLDSKLETAHKIQLYIFLIAGFFALFGGFTYYQLKVNKRVQKEISSKNEIIHLQNLELIESNNSLEHFAKVTANDISGPVNTISKLNGIYKNKFQKIFSPEDNDIIKSIDRNCNELIEMIQGFFNFSVVTKNLPNPENINLESMIKSIESNIKFLKPDKKIQINFENSLPIIKAHAFLISKLFNNLISNSVKYGKMGQPILINIQSKEIEDGFLIKLADNGIGMPEDFQSKAFDLFTKLHKKNEYAGHGIGLSTCKKIVNFYGGKIWLESEENEGTTIIFSINQ